jgi:mannose-6-phosphate isomerase-like protein (cupin superfamily)
MPELGSGCRVIEPEEGHVSQEGTRHRRRTVGAAIAARDIEQSVSQFDQGLSPCQVNPSSEEVHYVSAGSGACYIDGHRYDIEVGSSIYVGPGAECCFETSGGDLEVVSVCCPQIADSQFDLPPRTTPDASIDRSDVVVHERDRKSIPTGDRWFKLLADKDLGCQRVTQFIGFIPKSEAPEHYHTYEEAIYIVEGRGVMWADGKEASVAAGSCIYLPRQVKHSVKNFDDAPIRLMGVFHPSGSPAVRYDD